MSFHFYLIGIGIALLVLIGLVELGVFDSYL